jgi:flagellar basal body-associated protein FliL
LDNSNPTPPIQSQPTPQPMGQPTQQPVTLEQQNSQQMGNVSAPEGQRSSNKIIIFVVIALVLTILAVGGYYLYMNSQATEQGAKESQLPQATVSPTEEDQLNAINIEEVDKEFTQVDQDLQKL